MVHITKDGLHKHIILANIYIPPKNSNNKYRQFTQELTPILKSLENRNTECIITGDFNIDLLQISEKEVFSEFFDTLTESSFYLKITLPTRFSIKHGTLLIIFFLIN